MSKLIALVATAVMVNGERQVIQAGQPLPELSKHDMRELVQSGAAEDQTVKAAQNEADAAANAKAEADFAEARKRSEEEKQAKAAEAAKPKAPAKATPNK